MNDTRTYTALAAAGALPFAACALLPVFGVAALPATGPLDGLAVSYGLAIVSFLCGIHWATHLYNGNGLPFNFLIGSNVVFLVTWFAAVLTDVAAALTVQIAALLALLAIDYRLLTAQIISGDYFRARAIATGVAGLSLALITAR